MNHLLLQLSLSIALIGGNACAQTSASAARAHPIGDRTAAVSDAALERVRGGFAGAGFNISFGIERAVYIDGALVATTRLNATGLAGGSVTLIQSGLGNTLATGAMPAASIGTVVQNTLGGQKIQNVTTVNATVDSLNLMRGMNLVSSLRGAVIDSLRR